MYPFYKCICSFDLKTCWSTQYTQMFVAKIICIFVVAASHLHGGKSFPKPSNSEVNIIHILYQVPSIQVVCQEII